MKILIKSATIVLPDSKYHQQTVDILLQNGKIEKIEKNISAEVDQTIEMKNLHVSLGWFDSSICFGEPGYEERETLTNGLKTAAKSGFTSIAVNPNSNPIADHSTSIKFLKSHHTQFGVGVYPVGALTVKSESVDLAELFDMKNAGAVSFSDYKKPIENPNLLKIALQYAQNFDALIQSFPQENAIARNGCAHEDFHSTQLGLKGIPALAEELQIARDLFILEYTGGKLHIPTISTEKSVQLIKEAKKKGLDVSCSVAIHQLIFTDEKLQGFNANYKVLPPLRSSKDAKALIKGLKDGIIDMVTTDHCPIDIEDKKVEFVNAAYGTIGLETAFAALKTIFSTEKTIDLLTKGRARFGIENPKFEKGEIANLTLFNPDYKYTFNEENIISTSKNSMFIDSKINGKVYGIYANHKLTLA
ncbi:dihydroorotase [Mesonia aestuariivivens]|uniref:Dihydroorotase n=1 Tax=Mesonia aestuariivivens TaxID=2796128 RepID=A0ABS6W4K2_9FLAO|nr:dihydroorotase [Mesonia aestuariivivens]MBW2962787.1 dihydroorotase [Mesonia aestuariivivens]